MSHSATAPAHRSEAFVEDLFDDSRFSRPAAHVQRREPGRRIGAVVLCLVPLALAVLGGAVTFFQLMG